MSALGEWNPNANRVSSRVFRTSNLSPLPPGLNANDDQIASDHLPVLMIFGNPYDKPFRLTAITRSNPVVTLQWESVFGQPYRVDASSNLVAWTVLASNLTATGGVFTFTTNAAEALQFYRVFRQP